VPGVEDHSSLSRFCGVLYTLFWIGTSSLGTGPWTILRMDGAQSSRFHWSYTPLHLTLIWIKPWDCQLRRIHFPGWWSIRQLEKPFARSRSACHSLIWIRGYFGPFSLEPQPRKDQDPLGSGSYPAIRNPHTGKELHLPSLVLEPDWNRWDHPIHGPFFSSSFFSFLCLWSRVGSTGTMPPGLFNVFSSSFFLFFFFFFLSRISFGLRRTYTVLMHLSL
jgi:hypothetical protein